MRNYLTPGATESLVHALVSSRLDYCNSLLYGIPNYQVKRLQLLQNTAARIVTKTRKYEHITPVLRELHWLPVDYRIQYKILLLVFKCINGLAPVYLQDLLIKYEPVRELRSGSKRLLKIPKTRSKVGLHAFSVAGPKLWNSLPNHMRETSSLAIFKKSLKTFLFCKYYE